jgi:hypothetical protein
LTIFFQDQVWLISLTSPQCPAALRRCHDALASVRSALALPIASKKQKQFARNGALHGVGAFLLLTEIICAITVPRITVEVQRSEPCARAILPKFRARPRRRGPKQ